MTLATLTLFLGWCTALNIAVLLIATVALLAFRGPVMSIHARLTGVADAELPKLYFNYLGNYKLLIIVFNLIPWVALKLMAG